MRVLRISGLGFKELNYSLKSVGFWQGSAMGSLEVLQLKVCMG